MNILLQMEAKAVKNAHSVLSSRGHSELETGLFEQARFNKVKCLGGYPAGRREMVLKFHIDRCHLCWIQTQLVLVKTGSLCNLKQLYT